MQGYPSTLYDIIDINLKPYGFIERRDYVIGLDEPTCEMNGTPIRDHELPWCEKAEWLGSVVSHEKGNLVWHSSFERGV